MKKYVLHLKIKYLLLLPLSYNAVIAASNQQFPYKKHAVWVIIWEVDNIAIARKSASTAITFTSSYI